MRFCFEPAPTLQIRTFSVHEFLASSIRAVGGVLRSAALRRLRLRLPRCQLLAIYPRVSHVPPSHDWEEPCPGPFFLPIFLGNRL